MEGQWKPPAKIEDLYKETANNKFFGLNSDKAGARTEKALPIGEEDLQLYSVCTPNGVKVSILLEELGVSYDAHPTNILTGEQFNSGFVSVNPNSKIPSMLDKKGPDGNPINLFESGAICWYLAKKYNKFLPTDKTLETEILMWMFWQMSGQGPACGNFGHFFVYAPPEKIETRNYAVARYGMECKRLCSVLDQRLEGREYLVGNEYTIADILCFPWFNTLRKGYVHKESGVTAGEFLSVDIYKNVNAWADRILERPAVQRGLTVCNFQGVSKPWLVPKAEVVTEVSTEAKEK